MTSGEILLKKKDIKSAFHLSLFIQIQNVVIEGLWNNFKIQTRPEAINTAVGVSE